MLDCVMIPHSPTTREKLYSVIYKSGYHKKKEGGENSSPETHFHILLMHSLEFHSTNPKLLSGSPPFSLGDYRFATLKQGRCLPGNLMANPLPLPYKSLP